MANAHGHGLSEVALTLTRAPVIESFEPMLAERGKWVTLRGANFTGQRACYWVTWLCGCGDGGHADP